MATRITVAGLRRQMLARGLTLKPVCAVCGKEKHPQEFKRAGWCEDCDRRQRLEVRLAAIDAKLAMLWPGEREYPDNAALADEIRDLESERFGIWYELHPEECSRGE